MPTFDNGESGFSVRTKINAAIEKVDGTAPITAIDVNGGSIDGAIIGANAPVAVTATNLVANTDLTIASSTTVTAILDEDDLVSDSATALATQQSIKAYVDSQVGSTDELSEILANGNTSGANNIIINASQKITVDTIDETTADGGVTIDSVLLKDNAVVAATGTFTNLTANNDLTIAGTVTVTSILDEDNMASDDPAGLATQQSIKAYVDAQVGANNELSEVLANGNTTGGSDIIVSSGDVITTNTINETTSASGVTIDGILLKDGDITLSGSVDGRDIAADGTKLDGIEASADVTDTANVTASGALMTTGGAMTGAISTNSTFDGRDVATDGTKLDTIEASADVTDTANVTAAGALMDSEITNLDQVKAFDSADYATAAQGATADAALPKTGGAMTGAITTNSTFDGRNVSADGTKLDFITVTQAVNLDQMEIDIAALANGMVYKGDWDASSGSFPGSGSAQIGWFYYVSGAGTVDSVSFDIGDNIVAIADNASATTFSGNWSKHDQTDAVQSVVGLTGSIAKSSLLTALNVEDGADVTDTANVTAAGALMTTGGTMSGDINYGSSSAIFGTSPNTLSIYNDASNSYIDETGTGNLRVRGNNIQLEQSTGGELYMQAAADGTVRLYYDGQQRLFTSTSGIQVESDSAAAQIIIKSTEGGAGDGPRLDLYRASATPAADDDIGQIYFSGANSAGGKSQYAKIDTFIENATDGAEQARLDINLLSAGSGINMFRLRTDTGGADGEVVINDSSNDVDFRVESDNSGSALMVDGGTGIVSMSQGLNVTGKLEVSANNNGGAKANYIRITDTDTSASANNQQGGIEFFTNDVTPGIAASIEVLYAGTGGGGEITFNTNASSSGTLTEAVRINETGDVGIGTSSPNTYSGYTVLTLDNATNGGIIDFERGGNLIGEIFSFDSSTFALSAVGSRAINFSTNSLERMRIDSSGNVGIGTINPTVLLDLESASPIIRLTDSDASGTPECQISGAGGDLIFDADRDDEKASSVMSFKVDGSERMRIDANGVATFNKKIIVLAADGVADADYVALFQNQEATSGQNFGVSIAAGTSTADFALNVVNGAANTALLRVDGVGNTSISGDAAIGGTPLAGRELSVISAASTQISIQSGASNASVLNMGDTDDDNIGRIEYSNSDDEMVFRTNGGDRMRIDSGGRALIGYTSSNGNSYKLQVNSQIFATSSTIATSDGRYKENVTPITGALDLVSALNPVHFDWMPHSVHDFDTENTQIGFIAQEVEQVLTDKPYLRSIVKSNTCVITPQETDEDGNVVTEAITEDFLGIAEGNLVSLLTAALQEALSKIDSLEARISTLEA